MNRNTSVLIKNILIILIAFPLVFGTKAQEYNVNDKLVTMSTDEFLRSSAIQQVTIFRFMVGVRDPELRLALIDNDMIREKVAIGESFTYNGKTIVRDIELISKQLKFHENIYQETGLNLHIHSVFNDVFVVLVSSDNQSTTMESAAKKLFDTGLFNYVEEDQHVSLASLKQDDNQIQSTISPSLYNDEDYTAQVYWGRQVDGYAGAASIEAAKELMRSYGVFNSSKKVNIAVIDSGAIAHPDIDWAQQIDIKYTYDYDRGDDGIIWLNANQTGGRYFYESCSNRQVHGLGFLRDEPTPEQYGEGENAINWVRWDASAGYALRSHHGLNAASIIGAKSNNEIGIAGIIPHDNVNLVSINAVDDCDGYTSDNLMGMYWAIGELQLPFILEQINPNTTPAPQFPADVINMSFGATSTWCYLGDTGIQGAQANFAKLAYDRGVVLVASAGNDTVDVYGSAPTSCPYVISVGAITESGIPTSFTNYGQGITVMALGTSVPAATATSNHLGTLTTGSGGVSGTSFAGPIVAGFAGLLKLIDRDLTPSQITDIIQAGAKDLTVGVAGGRTSCAVLGCGAGAVNFEKSIKLLLTGEFLSQPVAKHYMANNAKKDNTLYLDNLTDFNPNMCNTYRMSGGIINDNYDQVEYTLLARNGNDDFQPVLVKNTSSFLFNNNYDDYKLQGCNLSTGSCSQVYDVEIDQNYIPIVCNR